MILFAGVPVADIADAREWYERLFGRPPDMTPHERELVWRVGEQGWVYAVEDRERAGRGLLTLMVDDLDGQVALLRERGLSPEFLPIGVRKAEVMDPDGNRVGFGEVP